MNEEERKRKIELCKNCYTCQQGIDSNISVDDIELRNRENLAKIPIEKRAELCRVCYSCQQGVDKSVTVDDIADQCKNCYSCERCVSCEQGFA